MNDEFVAIVERVGYWIEGNLTTLFVAPELFTLLLLLGEHTVTGCKVIFEFWWLCNDGDDGDEDEPQDADDGVITVVTGLVSLLFRFCCCSCEFNRLFNRLANAVLVFSFTTDDDDDVDDKDDDITDDTDVNRVLVTDVIGGGCGAAAAAVCGNEILWDEWGEIDNNNGVGDDAAAAAAITAAADDDVITAVVPAAAFVDVRYDCCCCVADDDDDEHIATLRSIGLLLFEFPINGVVVIIIGWAMVEVPDETFPAAEAVAALLI